ncbi:MAG: hypothetical protein Gaeavirus6_6 [Gaeavirus sp.]|uniref:Uncharacterized protein n=1 Tax=Gaeavirus sp. TaxID=2487767 RepID=A0A3G5A1G9_9VIRU|nr:MAG: hypothetical protein Gaeavirus6_6 [Gaeavirus sp.]
MEGIEFVFDTIDIKTQQGVQYESKLYVLENGMKTVPCEETGFTTQQYSGFPSSRFTTPDKRDYIRINLDPAQKSCVALQDRINAYDDAFHENKEIVFGKAAKMFTQVRGVKLPKVRDELELEALDPEKKKGPEFSSFRMKLDMTWAYYINNVHLDKDNTAIVRKGVFEALKVSKGDKTVLDSLSFNLKLPNDDGKIITRVVPMSELESRKDIDTKVYFRQVDAIPAGAKLPPDCTEEELTHWYGEGELVKVQSPEDMDKYYTHNVYTRFLTIPFKIWAARVKDQSGGRNTSIQWVCKQIDIVRIKSEGSSGFADRERYQTYAFGKKTTAAPPSHPTVTKTKPEDASDEIEDESESEEDDD